LTLAREEDLGLARREPLFQRQRRDAERGVQLVAVLEAGAVLLPARLGAARSAGGDGVARGETRHARRLVPHAELITRGVDRIAEVRLGSRRPRAVLPLHLFLVRVRTAEEQDAAFSADRRRPATDRGGGR